MPRQPYLSVVRRTKGAKYDLGTHCIGARPELERLICACIMSWPFIEAEMAVVLGQLLRAENDAALAVFESLRRSSAQRDAISAAAAASLNNRDQELLSAILNVHKAIEAERNALVHGHFGTASTLPKAIIWQNTRDYISLRAVMAIPDKPRWDEPKQKRLLSSIWVYREADLQHTYGDIRELTQLWYDLSKYLKTVVRGKEDIRAYSQLCGRSRIAQELDNIRRKGNASAPPQAPQPTPSELP